MASIVTNKAKEMMLSGDLDWVNDDIRVALVDENYTPDADQEFLDDGGANDVVDHEISVASYSRQTTSNRTVTLDDGNDEQDAGFDDVSFGALESGETVGAAIIYRHNAADTAAELLVVDDLTGNQALDGNTVTYQPANGIVFSI